MILFLFMWPALNDPICYIAVCYCFTIQLVVSTYGCRSSLSGASALSTPASYVTARLNACGSLSNSIFRLSTSSHATTPSLVASCNSTIHLKSRLISGGWMTYKILRMNYNTAMTYRLLHVSYE